MLTKCALGIQISEARTHTSIAAAGWVDEEFILVELAAYIEGTDAVADVLKLRRERTVSKIAIDPHSPAATVIKPLTKAGVRVTELTSSQVAVAFGEFVDALKAEQLKVAANPLLSAAVQHGTSRPLGGATTWQRRGTTVDCSPLDAATFAHWLAAARPAGYSLLDTVY